uniref:C-C motif chemokine 3 n=1 Tax=Anoplopoma fimbria TaxID=229290 RepID=C3KJQ6_ANOFI|nr:C-C motif chemokine 3 precursor [Anoplopoma fimbria]
MRFSLVLAALLCFVTWMSAVHATHAPVASCCLGRSDTKVHPKNILDYYYQDEGACKITAIVFLTKGGSRICSDPNSKWAKRVILKVDEKKALQEMGQVEEGSPSNTTPTVSLPLTNATQQKRRNGKGGRRGQNKCV